MISTVQESKVTEYLISKNLSLDLQIEIKDHMINQIMDLELEENLSFEEALSRVKELWKDEFKATGYWMFFREPIPLIAKKVIREKYNKFLKNSLFIGLLVSGINIVFIYMAKDAYSYNILFKALNSLFLLAPGLVWLLNFKNWKYMKPDVKFRGRCLYTMYQQNIGLMLICTISMAQLIMKNGHYTFQFFREQNHTNILMILMTLFIPFFLQTGIIFTLFNFFEHKKSLLKMKDFLKLNTDFQ